MLLFLFLCTWFYLSLLVFILRWNVTISIINILREGNRICDCVLISMRTGTLSEWSNNNFLFQRRSDSAITSISLHDRAKANARKTTRMRWKQGRGRVERINMLMQSWIQDTSNSSFWYLNYRISHSFHHLNSVSFELRFPAIDKKLARRTQWQHTSYIDHRCNIFVSHTQNML